MGQYKFLLLLLLLLSRGRPEGVIPSLHIMRVAAGHFPRRKDTFLKNVALEDAVVFSSVFQGTKRFRCKGVKESVSSVFALNKIYCAGLERISSVILARAHKPIATE